jgi:hypothetical protein
MSKVSRSFVILIIVMMAACSSSKLSPVSQITPKVTASETLSSTIIEPAATSTIVNSIPSTPKVQSTLSPTPTEEVIVNNCLDVSTVLPNEIIPGGTLVVSKLVDCQPCFDM